MKWVRLEENPWISVKDRLPDKNEKVVVSIKHGNKSVCVTGFLDGSGNGWQVDWDPEDPSFEAITHWMPIPPLPEEK
jgi:hypothetical protein